MADRPEPTWHPLPGMNCPYCQVAVNTAAALVSKGLAPRPRDGSIVICGSCCELSLVIDTSLLGLRLRKLSGPEKESVIAQVGDITAWALQRKQELEARYPHDEGPR